MIPDRRGRFVPTVECKNCEETFPQEDGPTCPYCGHDHSEVADEAT